MTESLITLLKNPNAENFLEQDIADMFSNNYKQFEARAKEFTQTYAKWINNNWFKTFYILTYINQNRISHSLTDYFIL